MRQIVVFQLIWSPYRIYIFKLPTSLCFSNKSWKKQQNHVEYMCILHGFACPRLMTDSTLKHIPLNQITPDPHQPRDLPASFQDLKSQKESGDKRALEIWNKLRELATSILESGLEQPITVNPSKTNPDQYIIYDGHRRWLAVCMLHAESHWDGAILAHVREDEKTEGATLLGQITVNVQRDELNVFELARGLNQIYQQLKVEGGTINYVEEDGSIKEEVLPVNASGNDIWSAIEHKIGIGRSRRYQIQAVLKLPEEAQVIAEKGGLSENTLRMIIPIKDKGVQLQITQEAVQKDMSPADVRVRIDELLRGEEESPTMPKPRRILRAIKYLEPLKQDIAAVSDIANDVAIRDPRTVESYKQTIPELKQAQKDLEWILNQLSFLEGAWGYIRIYGRIKFYLTAFC